MPHSWSSPKTDSVTKTTKAGKVDRQFSKLIFINVSIWQCFMYVKFLKTSFGGLGAKWSYSHKGGWLIRLLQLAIYQTLPLCSFFQKVPFDMDFIWKMKMKSSFFIWNIKKTCAARGSLRSSPHPSLPPPTNPTQKFDISMFLYQKQKGGSFK